MSNYFILKEEKGNYQYMPCLNFKDSKNLKGISSKVRQKILMNLAKEPMYPSELAKKLKINEQNLYYHVNSMLKQGILEVYERKEIRGTTAKKLRPISTNFSLTLDQKWQNIQGLLKRNINKKLDLFFEDFIDEGIFNGEIIVGSPDPHGPFKARARDGHYAIDLSFFLGNILEIPKEFTTKLDVDCNLETENNAILVGGPVTNQLMSDVNKYLPVFFSDKKPWALISKATGKKYIEETTGLIAKIPNPNDKKRSIILLAGISAVGTKAAVIALTRHYSSLFTDYNGQKIWYKVINGIDFDGDGKVDSAEILE
ncbi:MAG: helix-turn-helix domain-containing protein [Nanoarchaeota archaeon]